MSTSFNLKTKRLVLRPFNSNDLNDLYEYLRTIEVHCFLSMKVNTLDEAKNSLNERIGKNDYLAITLDNKVIGEIFFSAEPIDPEFKIKDTYDICYMINDKYKGNGYSYEAAHAVLDYLFNTLNVRRIFAYTEDYNIASQGLLKKLGMRQEAFYKEFISFINDDNGDPIYENTLEFAILKSEWNK